LDRIDYEFKIIDLLVEARFELSSEEYETLLTRIEEAVNYVIK
jgi:hypothetical protein